MKYYLGMSLFLISSLHGMELTHNKQYSWANTGPWTIARVQSFLAFGASVNFRDKDGCSLLHLAALKGDQEMVKLSLSTPEIDINAAMMNGLTPLHCAAIRGHEAIVQLLMTSPLLTINAEDSRGKTPLFYAIKNNNVNVQAQLIQVAGIKLDPTTASKALHYAAHTGDENLLALLINIPGINVNIPEEDGATPLHFAAKKGKENIMKLLLAHPEINVNAENKNGESALYIATWEGHLAVVNLLLTKPDLDLRTKWEGETLLHAATFSNNEEVVAAILKHTTISPTTMDSEGVTPLHLAACKGNANIITQFCNARIDINFPSQWPYTSKKLTYFTNLLTQKTELIASDPHQWTPLHVAAYYGQESVVATLLSLPNIEVNASDERGRTPLYLAARNGHEKAVELLINYVATNVNAADHQGHTPLHMATKRKHEAIVRLLVSCPRISLNPPMSDGWTPLGIAHQKKHDAIVHLLRSAGAINMNPSTYKAFHKAAENGNKKKLIQILKTPGLDVNARNRENETALHLAAMHGHIELVQLLLAHKASIDLASYAETPLYKAARRGHV